MTEPQARELGAFIREKRDQRALTLMQLEAMTGIPDSWLYHFEKGHYTQPAPARLSKLADALDIDAAYIDRISSDHLADSLPGTRVYFRSKEKLGPEALDELELAVARIRRKYGAKVPSEETQS
jgi:transcriptional regulator with XRE-family HTH domain